MASTHHWNAELYDNKLDFVSHFGKDVVDLLNPQPGEVILDLGCGTGDLTQEIASSGAHVYGMDYSVDMIQAARDKYPNIVFEVGNAEQFRLDQPVDAVFSNAALHWVKQAEDVIASVWNNLKDGGRFVAEFGGKGNVDHIVRAIYKVLEEESGIDGASLNPWYFPSISQYSTLLERQGFTVTYAVHFQRPTKLLDGDNGMAHWLEGFAGDVFFGDFKPQEKEAMFNTIKQHVKADLFKEGHWYADYARLRIVAVKFK